MADFLSSIGRWIRWQDILQILILSFVFYKLLLFIRGTRAIQVLKGMVVLIVAAFVFKVLELDILNKILGYIFGFGVIAILIVFHPELRRGLAKIGQNPLFGPPPKRERVVDEVVKSANLLSRRRIGALIVLEREVGLRSYIETGVELDSNVSSELLTTIFMPNTPLHDGAAIIQGEKVTAAACILPLAEVSEERKSLGTRHRAALGLSEETDAVVVAISEESGDVFLTRDGKLTEGLDGTSLREALMDIYSSEMAKGSLIWRWRGR